jgi:hypothetical protein
MLRFGSYFSNKSKAPFDFPFFLQRTGLTSLKHRSSKDSKAKLMLPKVKLFYDKINS